MLKYRNYFKNIFILEQAREKPFSSSAFGDKITITLLNELSGCNIFEMITDCFDLLKRLSAIVPKIRFEMGYRFISEKWIDSWFNKNVLLLNLKAYF